MNSDDIRRLPIRNIYQIQKNEGLRGILKKDDSIRGKDFENNPEARPIEHNKKYRFDLDTVQTIEYFAKSNAIEKPCYCIFLHDKMDGILSAYQLSDMLVNQSVMLTRAFLGNSSINCIKQRKLLKISLQYGIISKKRFLSTDKLLQLIMWGTSILFSLLNFLVTVLTATVYDQPLLLNYPFYRFVPVLFFVFFGILALLLSYFRVRECRNDMMNQVKIAVERMSLEAFSDFLKNFVAEDYVIPNLPQKTENINIICPLSSYSPRERAVLLQYWNTNTRCEFWWIFEELNPHKDLFILTQSSKYHSKFYRLMPLTFVEKRKLATEFGRSMHDPGLKPFGIDYIASKLLHDFLMPDRETEESLCHRLDQFVNQYQNQYPFNIPRVIRLVAELSVTFHVDYSISQTWESIFSYGAKDSLTALDFNLSTELVNGVNPRTVNIKILRQLKNLVSLILSEFEFNLYQVIKIDYGPRLMITDVQLHLVKAIRCEGENEEIRCLAIAECLYFQLKNYVDNPKTFSSSGWLTIIEESLQLFQKQKFGWFSASLIHLLIELWEKTSSEKLKSLLRKKVVQDSAKENLFFYNQERHLSENATLSVVEDHIRLSKLLLVNSSEEPEENLFVPSWTSLLNLTDKQCKLYVIALNKNNERTIPQYYQVLFEMFTIMASRSKTVLCQHLFPSVVLSFQETVEKLLALVLQLGEDRNCYVPEGCGVLLKIISTYKPYCKISEELTSECLYYMTLWDAVGFSIGSFVASIVFQEAQLNVWDNAGSKRIGDSEIGIDMGNSVARLIYLTCMQTREGGFLNRQAIELTDILTSYQHPSLPILGYIINLSMYTLPKHCIERLQAYFLAMKPAFELCPTKNDVESEKLIEYIIDVMACSVLNEETKKEFFHAVLVDFETYYGELKDAPIIKEFLCRYESNQSTEIYCNSDPEHILDETLKLCASSDMVYLLYSELYEENKFLSKHCDRLAAHLLRTSLGGGILLLIRNWIEVTSVAPVSRNYFHVASLIYISVSKETTNYVNGTKQSLMDEARIDVFYSFLEALNDKVTNRIEPYFRFFSKREIEKIEGYLSELKQRIMIIVLSDIVSSQSWTSLPLLTCIGYILEHAVKLKKMIVNRKYEAMCSQEERNEWLSSNLHKLCPIVNTSGGSVISKEFIDLVNLATMKKDWDFTNRVQAIVEKHITGIVNIAFDNEERRHQIIRLIEIVRKSYNTVEL